MIKVEFCGYHTHNPNRELIYRPSGTASYLFLLVLSPMHFHFPDHTVIQALPGACILYEPGAYQHYQAEDRFFNSYVHFFVTAQLWINITFRQMSCFIRTIQKKFTGF